MKFENVSEVQAHYAEYVDPENWGGNPDNYGVLFLLYTDDGSQAVFGSYFVYEGDSKTVYAEDSNGGIGGPYFAHRFSRKIDLEMKDGELREA